MQDHARELLIQMVRDCGEDITRMQASFVMYANQYLADYPEEKQLLVDAYKVGIPQKIIQHAGETEYAKYLRNLGPRFAEAARRPEDEAAWGVETWALALNRTADYVPPARLPDRLYPEQLVTEDTPELKAVTAGSMALIVVAGGVIGGILAACLVPMMFFGLTFANDIRPPAMQEVHSEWEQVAVFMTAGLIAGAISGIAAFGGWFLGRGAEYPWAGFCTAGGTAFTMTLICFAVLPIVIQPIVLFGSVFAAVFRTAARGGND